MNDCHIQLLSEYCFYHNRGWVKAAITWWGVQAPFFRIASLGKTQTNTSLEAAGSLFTVSPEFPAEKQLKHYSVLWFYYCFL